MEEDIKILEEFYTKGYPMMYIKYGGRIKANSKIERALENLIKGYRELEEREIWSTATINGLKRDFIPKSKIMKLKHDLEEEYISLGKNKTEQSIHVMLGLNSAIDKISKLVGDK